MQIKEQRHLIARGKSLSNYCSGLEFFSQFYNHSDSFLNFRANDYVLVRSFPESAINFRNKSASCSCEIMFWNHTWEWVRENTLCSIRRIIHDFCKPDMSHSPGVIMVIASWELPERKVPARVVLQSVKPSPVIIETSLGFFLNQCQDAMIRIHIPYVDNQFVPK